MMKNILAKINNSTKISISELSSFCKKISMILKSGISLQDGVLLLLEEEASPNVRAMLSEVNRSLDEGNSFYAALKGSNCFPAYMLNMVNIGEQSGKTEDVMNSLHDYYVREQSISSEIKTAVAYPCIMVAMMLTVIGVLIIKVLPIFSKVFNQLGGQMNSFSLGLMHMGSALVRYSFLISCIVGIMILFFVVSYIIKKRRNESYKLTSKLFFTKKLHSKIAVGHFASAMSLMMSSGLDIDDSLRMSYQLVEDENIKKKIKTCQSLIDDGMAFSQSITSVGLFTPIETSMLTISFKTGSTEEIIAGLADRYEEEISYSLTHLISIIEPTLVATMSIIVGLILMSVMLPLLGVMSSINF